MPSENVAVLPTGKTSKDQQLIENDMLAVDHLIRQSLHSDVVLINQVAEYIIHSGGKRLRPLLHLLAARACGYTGEQHIRIAAIIEFIHTATLLHDDVVDESDRRRGQSAAHTVWGNAASVLVGDFLYSRSFEMMVEVGSMPVMAILSRTTNVISEGEVQQLLQMGNPALDEAQYLQVIESKTARLFSAACELGAVISGGDLAMRDAMARFGVLLGSAFQIMDDVLDYTADEEQLGKSLGDDLAEGKATLPLIYARMAATPEQRERLDDIIQNGKRESLSEVHALLLSTGAAKMAQRKAEQLIKQAEKALLSLPQNLYRDELLNKCKFVVQRNS